MVYSPPSPSDTGSNWSSNFSDSDATPPNFNAAWTGQELDLPITPAMGTARLSVTSAPSAITPSPLFNVASPASNARPMGSRPKTYIQDPDTLAPSAITPSPSLTVASPASNARPMGSRPKTYIQGPDTLAPSAITPSPSLTVASPASNARPTDTQQKDWIQDPDTWEEHREVIEALYVDHTLIQLEAIMKREHDFKATKRMYKSRFQQWGVKKNTTAADVKKLKEKLEKLIQYEQRHRGGSGAGRMTTFLDINENEVKKVLKYIKRNPDGLKKMREDPRRPLDIFQSLLVDSGKGRSGRTRVSIPTVKLEQEQRQSQFHMLTPPPCEPMVHWTPQASFASSTPLDMDRLLQVAVDQEFNTQYAQSCCPPMPASPTASYHWQTHAHSSSQSSASPLASQSDAPPMQEEMMLRFVLEFRLAHILLDDGLRVEAYKMTEVGLDLLSTRLQMIQGADGRAVCTVLLYAVMAALEMAVNTSHVDLLQMLFCQINSICAVQQPMMAEFTGRLSQLDRAQQIKALKMAKRLMSPISFGYEGNDNPGLEMYSRTVDISIGSSAPEEKLRALQAMSGHACVQRVEDGSLWMEKRVALSVADQWGCGQDNKAMIFLRYTSDRVDWHRTAGHLGMVEKWAWEAAWACEMTLGSHHELTCKLREDADSVRPHIAPMLGHGGEQFMPVSVAPSASHPFAHPQPQLGALSLGMEQLPHVSFKEERDRDQAESDSSWAQTPRQVHFGGMALPSMWEGAGATSMDGGVGGLYDACFGGGEL